VQLNMRGHILERGFFLESVVQCCMYSYSLFYNTNGNFLQCWPSHPYWQGLAWLGHCHKCHKYLRVYWSSHGSSQCRFMSHFLRSILLGIFSRYTWLWNTLTALWPCFALACDTGYFWLCKGLQRSNVFMVSFFFYWTVRRHSEPRFTMQTRLWQVLLSLTILMLCALRTLTPYLLAHAFDPTLTQLWPQSTYFSSCQLMNLVAYLDVSVACLLALISLQPCAHSSMSRSLAARHRAKWHSFEHSNNEVSKKPSKAEQRNKL
jgi:hypothetical protein